MSLADSSVNLTCITGVEFHEIQVGTFSVIGRFPVLVLAHLKEIFESSSRPLFIGSSQLVQVLLDDATQEVQDHPAFENQTLILDPLNGSHKKLADGYKGKISWFCIQNMPYLGYRGTYFDYVNRELIYMNENNSESYVLSGSVKATRELAAAICAARESGIDPDEIRLTLKASPSLPKLQAVYDSAISE